MRLVSIVMVPPDAARASAARQGPIPRTGHGRDRQFPAAGRGANQRGFVKIAQRRLDRQCDTHRSCGTDDTQRGSIRRPAPQPKRRRGLCLLPAGVIRPHQRMLVLKVELLDRRRDRRGSRRRGRLHGKSRQWPLTAQPACRNLEYVQKKPRRGFPLLERRAVDRNREARGVIVGPARLLPPISSPRAPDAGAPGDDGLEVSAVVPSTATCRRPRRQRHPLGEPAARPPVPRTATDDPPNAGRGDQRPPELSSRGCSAYQCRRSLRTGSARNNRVNQFGFVLTNSSHCGGGRAPRFDPSLALRVGARMSGHRECAWGQSSLRFLRLNAHRGTGVALDATSTGLAMCGGNRYIAHHGTAAP